MMKLSIVDTNIGPHMCSFLVTSLRNSWTEAEKSTTLSHSRLNSRVKFLCCYPWNEAESSLCYDHRVVYFYICICIYIFACGPQACLNPSPDLSTFSHFPCAENYPHKITVSKASASDSTSMDSSCRNMDSLENGNRVLQNHSADKKRSKSSFNPKLKCTYPSPI